MNSRRQIQETFPMKITLYFLISRQREEHGIPWFSPRIRRQIQEIFPMKKTLYFLISRQREEHGIPWFSPRIRRQIQEIFPMKKDLIFPDFPAEGGAWNSLIFPENPTTDPRNISYEKTLYFLISRQREEHGISWFSPRIRQQIQEIFPIKRPNISWFPGRGRSMEFPDFPVGRSMEFPDFPVGRSMEFPDFPVEGGAWNSLISW